MFYKTVPSNYRYLVNKLYEEEQKRLRVTGADLIRELHRREFEIAFLSNANSWQYQALNTALAPLIAEVSGRLFASCRMGVAKPNPKLYAILNPAGYGEVLYFGNSIRNDYLFALKGRVCAFLFTPNMSLAKYQQIAPCWLSLPQFISRSAWSLAFLRRIAKVRPIQLRISGRPPFGPGADVQDPCHPGD